LVDHGFRSGLVLGLLAALGVALLAATERGKRRVRPGAGLGFTVAAVLALTREFTLGSDFVLGLVVLAAGGWLTRRVDGPVVRMLAAVPGAVFLARSTDLHDPSWAVAVMLVVTVVGGTLVADFDRSFATTGLPPVLLAVTVLGVYVTTPDTDHAVILLGVALPIAGLGWPRPIASLGAAGSSLVTGLVSWVVVTDGAARPGAIVGALACLGLLVLEPASRWTSRARAAVESSLPVGSVPLLLALHVGVVAVCSRVAGLRTPATQALVISAVTYALVAAVLVGVGRRSTAPRPSGDNGQDG
jgi:hypothetical protein